MPKRSAIVEGGHRHQGRIAGRQCHGGVDEPVLAGVREQIVDLEALGARPTVGGHHQH